MVKLVGWHSLLRKQFYSVLVRGRAMSWSTAQKNRLAIEKDLLERYFQDRVKWYNPTSFDANVEIKMTSNSNKRYTFRVYLPENFPNSCPDMVLVSPQSFPCKNGRSIPSTSHEFYTIGMRNGCLKLCHFRPQMWTADNTLYQVFMKGRLWIEGYEAHLNTGKDMDVFLKHQPPSPSSSNATSIPHSDEERKKCVIS